MHFPTVVFSSLLKKIATKFRSSISPSDIENPPVVLDPAEQIITKNPPQKFKLSGAILGFCFASVLSLLMLYFQIKTELPLLVHLFAFAITCAFASIFVAKFIGGSSSYLGKVLKRVGYVFTSIAFFLAITVPSPLWLRVIYWSIFVISLFLVLKYCYAPISEDGIIQEDGISNGSDDLRPAENTPSTENQVLENS